MFVLLWQGTDRCDTGMFGFQEHLSVGYGLMSSPVCLPMKEAHRHTHTNSGLINVTLVLAEIFSHEAHLRCGMKPMPGKGVTCGFEPENTDT